MGSMPLLATLRARLGATDPPLAWTLRGYRRPWLRGDLLAGVTVAALIVPLSIGYAQVAGLPPEAGLYASLVPLVAYAVFGSSRRLVVGPDAATAALVAAAIVPLASAADERMRLASALALLVALVFVRMRLAALGFLADFLSRPLLVGYMTGVGISVAMDQIPKILGGRPLAGVLTVAGRHRLRRRRRRRVPRGRRRSPWAAPRSTCRRSSSAVPSWRRSSSATAGCPASRSPCRRSSWPWWPASPWTCRPAGCRSSGRSRPGCRRSPCRWSASTRRSRCCRRRSGIAILSFADTALTGRNFAAPHREGTSRTASSWPCRRPTSGASLTSGYPVSSSASRTPAAEAAGSQTQLTGIIAAGAVAVVLLFLTAAARPPADPGPRRHRPGRALRFIEAARSRRIWRLDRARAPSPSSPLVAVDPVRDAGRRRRGRPDGGVQRLPARRQAAHRRARPPAGDDFADLDRSTRAAAGPGVLIVRFAGPLFFATANPFRARIRSLLVERPDARVVVVDATGIVDLDLTAAEGLAGLRQDLRGPRTSSSSSARPTGALRDLLRTFGLGDLVGSGDDVRRDLASIVEAIRWTAHRASWRSTSAARTTPSARQRRHRRPTRRHRWSIGVVLLGTALVGILAGAVLAGSDRDPGSGSSGEVSTPNIIGLPYDRARTALEDVGLVLGTPTFVQTAALAEGTVIDQVPAPGSLALEGSVVTPTVSTRRGLVTVPDVAGSTEADAIVALTGAGLRVGSTTAHPAPIAPAGTVIATEPEAGREVAVDTEIRMTVSSGPAGPTAPPTSAPTATPAPTTAPARPARRRPRARRPVPRRRRGDGRRTPRPRRPRRPRRRRAPRRDPATASTIRSG